jgi:hypothetical protein
MVPSAGTQRKISAPNKAKTNDASPPGLPDVIFANQKIQFGYFLVGLGIERLLYLTAVWYVLQPIVIFKGHLVYL